MANYHVTKAKGRNEWQAKREKANRTAGFYETQAEAEQVAKKLAANSGGGEVMTHGRDGKIRSKDTVEPGNDPFPPRDTEH